MSRRILLVGGGHAHLQVLAAWAARPVAGVALTLVTPVDRQLYSGMLPGWIAGHYTLEQCAIPLAPLAAAAGARLVLGRVEALDLARRVAAVDTGTAPPARSIDADIVSLDIGPVTALPPAWRIPGVIPLRPLEPFVAHVAHWLQQAAPAGAATALTIVGGGAGGVELALAVAWRSRHGGPAARVRLVSGRAGVVPTLARRARAHVHAALDAAGVRIVPRDAVAFAPGSVLTDDGARHPSDLTWLATGAAAAAWPRASGLAVDPAGFIAVDAQLQSVSHRDLFAAGDCASRADAPRPRSGVYAVRAGPVLAANLRRAALGEPLRPWQPQRHALYLLATGGRHAVATWGPLTAAGRWAWRWKDRIDRRFIARFISPVGPARR